MLRKFVETFPSAALETLSMTDATRSIFADQCTVHWMLIIREPEKLFPRYHAARLQSQLLSTETDPVTCLSLSLGVVIVMRQVFIEVSRDDSSVIRRSEPIARERAQSKSVSMASFFMLPNVAQAHRWSIGVVGYGRTMRIREFNKAGACMHYGTTHGSGGGVHEIISCQTSSLSTA